MELLLVQRRYDIDALRVIAIFLLIFYHCAIIFQPWARELLWFPQSGEHLEILWSLMQALNIWRIPLLFVVSGVGFAFVMKQRNKKQLLSDRGVRILLPAVVGSIFIVPIHFWLLVVGTDQEYVWSFTPSHLWFLFNIFIYVLIGIIPLHFLRNTKIKSVLVMTYSLSLVLGLETMIVPIIEYSGFAVTLHGFVVGGVCFCYGFFLAKSDSWKYLKVSAFGHLVFALGLFLSRILFWDNKAPMLLVSAEASLWLLAVLGLAYRYLNKNMVWLNYLSPAVYPMYILHMIVMYAICRLMLPITMPPELKFTIIVSLTILGSYLGYCLLRQIPYLRKLFGMR